MGLAFFWLDSKLDVKLDVSEALFHKFRVACSANRKAREAAASKYGHVPWRNNATWEKLYAHDRSMGMDYAFGKVAWHPKGCIYDSRGTKHDQWKHPSWYDPVFAAIARAHQRRRAKVAEQ